MDTREAYTKMITAYPGGWPAMAAALGMTKDALENRVYERKGQQINVHTAMQLQAFSQTTLFAEAISQESDGIFVKLPDLNECDHEELLGKFNQLYAELGQLSEKFSHHTQDGKIDRREKRDLTNTSQQIHRTVQELMILTFAIYCPREAESEKRGAND
ncbi:YmfL family putative regulatory protein [Nitrosomonas oligotropha]|nr:YmfL family putative regulatory protein [Nitrosomonas oligotropha]